MAVIGTMSKGSRGDVASGDNSTREGGSGATTTITSHLIACSHTDVGHTHTDTSTDRQTHLAAEC